MDGRGKSKKKKKKSSASWCQGSEEGNKKRYEDQFPRGIELPVVSLPHHSLFCALSRSRFGLFTPISISHNYYRFSCWDGKSTRSRGGVFRLVGRDITRAVRLSCLAVLGGPGPGPGRFFLSLSVCLSPHPCSLLRLFFPPRSGAPGTCSDEGRRRISGAEKRSNPGDRDLCLAIRSTMRWGGRTWVLEAWAVENNPLEAVSLSLSSQHLPHPPHLAAYTYTQTQGRTPLTPNFHTPTPPSSCSDLKGTVPVFDTCRVRDSLVLFTTTILSFLPSHYLFGVLPGVCAVTDSGGAAARSVLRVVG